KEQQCAISEINWEDTNIKLPDTVSKWQHLLLDDKGTSTGQLEVQQLFSEMPFALLLFKAGQERAAGILLHISSLPSPFGIGDLGSEARKFADFLYRSKQKYW